ncbi:facilitated trehalose transporter Tret1-like [Anticarsia gemmatalis]|uniref:facilitated trehalose transporter Tret1-like n=1 Tax=Anticarsia gemmatalis TaxID=129554 RepID=UPI003F76553B
MTKLNVIEAVVPEQLVKSTHICRQICATIAASLLSLSGGLTFGFTAVMLPQLEADPEFPYDKKFDSWIASISPLAMIMGCLFSGSMSDGIGRKMGQIVLIFPFMIGWIIMGFSTNNVFMLIGRFITGICTGAIRPNTMVYIGELTDPKYRAIALFIPSAAIHIGAFISHVVGKYVYWRYSCFVFIIPNLITLTMLMFVKESPLWLLTKGKIDEGIISFRLFRGNGETSEKELAKVLEKCQEKTEQSNFKDNMDIIFSKPFMKSLMTILLLFIAVQWCGINTLSFYAEEIFEKTFSGDIDSFMLMLVTDCIRVLASVVVCIFARVIPRKPTFVGCCFSTSIVLVALVVYLYLNPAGLVWLAVICMVAYIMIASALTCISWSFVAEIFPSKVRGFGSGLSSGMSFGLLFISVKVTPTIMAKYGESAMYAGFAVVTLISGVFLSFILPETSGKSLQDIEDSLYKKKGGEKSNIDIVTVPTNPQV